MTRFLKAGLCALVLMVPAACQPEPDRTCEQIDHAGALYTVCTFPADAQIRLFHTAPDGEVYGQFDRLAETLEAENLNLLFAMNGGMYHQDRRAVGLYVEAGQQIAPLVTRAGPGNFGMLPNGVFWIDRSGTPHVTETLAYAALAPDAEYATQSGPMLVIDGELHPGFNEDGPSRKRRNGVGVSADGGTVYFAISDVPVNFHGFASLFRDHLGTPNALYLDGMISRIYAPELGRNEAGLDMGPIVAVVSGPSEN